MARGMRRASCVAILLLCLGTAASAQLVQLRHKYRQGERLRYGVTLKGNGTISSPTLGRSDPFDMSGALTYVTDVQKVDAAGNATLHIVVEDSSINATLGGQALPVTLNLPPITAKVRPTGKIDSCTVAAPMSQQLPDLGGLSGAGAMTEAFDFTKFFGTTQNVGFPSHPVSPGSEWSDSVTITTPEGAKLQMKTKSKLLGFSTYQGRHCAKIRTAFTVPLSMQMAQLGIPFVLSGSEEGTVTTYFALAEGRMIGSVGKVMTDMTMSTGLAGVGAGQQSVSASMRSQTDVRVSLAAPGSAVGRSSGTRGR
jgi:hypothetical protein